jgi:DNA-binding GntR family transcriptional regulator
VVVREVFGVKNGRQQGTLREKVYDFLSRELAERRLKPGTYVDMNKLLEQLDVSRTPLRDALILLEAEGIVTIYPRRGVMVNPVSRESILNVYQLGAGLESVLMSTVFDHIAPIHVRRMKEIVDEALALFREDNYNRAVELNLAFHKVFHDLSKNALLRQELERLYNRLFYFPRRSFNSEIVKRQERDYWMEHLQIIAFIEKGQRTEAADFLRDVHWAFKEDYVVTLHTIEA